MGREAEGVGGEGKCESSGQPPVDEVESPGADAAEGKGTTFGTAMEEAAEVTRHEILSKLKSEKCLLCPAQYCWVLSISFVTTPSA